MPVMRIVAGVFKGRKLLAPRGRGVRPTIERVREAVFDVLGPFTAGARVLDLFAGSGAMGLEALSRGAAFVTWCDVNPRAVKAVKANIERLQADPAACSVMHSDAMAAVRALGKLGERFDLVFVDPPYEAGLLDEVMMALSLSGVVRRGGLVVLEHSCRTDPGAGYGGLVVERRTRYGDTCISWLWNRSETEVGT